MDKYYYKYLKYKKKYLNLSRQYGGNQTLPLIEVDNKPIGNMTFTKIPHEEPLTKIPHYNTEKITKDKILTKIRSILNDDTYNFIEDKEKEIIEDNYNNKIIYNALVELEEKYIMELEKYKKKYKKKYFLNLLKNTYNNIKKIFVDITRKNLHEKFVNLKVKEQQKILKFTYPERILSLDIKNIKKFLKLDEKNRKDLLDDKIGYINLEKLLNNFKYDNFKIKKFFELENDKKKEFFNLLDQDENTIKKFIKENIKKSSLLDKILKYFKI